MDWMKVWGRHNRMARQLMLAMEVDNGNIMHYEPKCSSGHRSRQVCVGRECLLANPFICEECKGQPHQGCEVIPYKELVRKLHSKQGLRKADLLRYEDYVENTFSVLMKSLRAEFVAFREMFEHVNANPPITEFYQQLKSHREGQLTGRKVSALLESDCPHPNKYRLKSQAVMWSLSGELVELQKRVNKKLPFYYSLYDDVREENIELEENHPIKQVEAQFRRYRDNLVGGLLENSINKVETLFQKDIYNLQLLYRASQHDFSASAFHAACDGKKNTLTVVKTEFGNVVGAFCAIPWRSPGQWEYEEDPHNETFLFSLGKQLEGLKFEPVKRKFTVGMHKEYGPCFGDDLVIYDKANSSRGCWSNFPDCYICKTKAVPHDEKTIREFVGVDDHYRKFNLAEWEVYKVSFSKAEQMERSFMEQYRQI